MGARTARKRATFASAAVAALASIVGACASSAKLDARLTKPGANSEPPGIKPVVKADGASVPDDTFTTLDGTKARFADLRGKPLVVNMWAQSCVPCVTEMPAFESVHKELGDTIAFVGVNAQDGVNVAKAFAAKVGVTYPLWLDHGGAAQAALKVTVLPTTLFVSPGGTVLRTHFGALTADGLKATITELFG